MLTEFNRGDVIGKVDHQTGIFVVRSGQVQGVSNAQRFLLDDVMDAFARQTLTNVAGNLADKTVGDDGDVVEACAGAS